MDHLPPHARLSCDVHCICMAHLTDRGVRVYRTLPVGDTQQRRAVSYREGCAEQVEFQVNGVSVAVSIAIQASLFQGLSLI